MANNWTQSQLSAMNQRGKLVLVSAAAGSGKTSVLTERIIRTLIDESHPISLDRLLVVTFTRSAAAELKSRISAALSNALAEHPDSAHLQKQIFLLGSAQISTIDSFFGDAVRRSFDELELPASFRLADKSEIFPIARQVMDATVRNFYEKYESDASSGSAFEKLRSNRFADAMDNILSNRSNGSLDEDLIAFASRFDAYPEGLKLLRDSAADLRDAADRDFFSSRVGKCLLDTLTETFSYFSRELKVIGEYLKYDDAAAAKTSGIHASDSDFCQAVLTAIAKGSYAETRDRIMSYQNPRFQTCSPKPPMMEYYHGLRKKLKEAVDKFQASYFSWGTEEVREQLLRTAASCDLLCDLFSAYNLRIMEEKRERGLLEFNDVRSLLYRLLVSEDGAPSAYARSLADRYDAVYIDEYQDVDYMQDRIFSIIGEDRRFMVGDIKQSIYGFRGSEPSIFSSYRRSMPLHDAPDAETSNAVCVFMSENFRCDRPVIDFANTVCSFLFSACEKTVGYRPEDDLKCQKRPPEKEAHLPIDVQTVVFEPYPKKSSGANDDNADEDEKFPRESMWIAAEISRLLREGRLDNGDRIQPSDIAILARTAAQGDGCAAELKALGIPFSAKGDKDLLHSPLMTDTLNLLRTIDNPYRDLPLSEYLLSEKGGFTLEELSVIRENASESLSLYDALTAAADNRELPVCEKASAFVSWLENWRQLASVQAADRLLRLLYLDPLFSTDAREPELLFLYEQARLYQRTSYCGLFGFLDHMTAKIEKDELSAAGFRPAERAVSIMTIHGSKGLEFPVVFLAACGASFKKGGTPPPLYYHRKAGFASALYDKSSKENRPTVILETVKSECRLDETEESIRTLYVALTRAREQLYVTGTLGGKLDSALASAKMIRRGSRHSILGASSYLRWILAALSEKHDDPSEYPCAFRFIPLSEDVAGEVYAVDPLDRESCESLPSDENASRYTEILDRQKEFQYPASSIRDLPTKAAASKLRPDLIDLITSENDEEALKIQIRLMESAAPAFDRLMDDRKQPNAAEIGTATHAFLEFCSLDSLSALSIEDEIDRLVSEEFITSETAARLNRSWLQAFLQSDLADSISHAVELHREQKFSLLLPLSKLTREHRYDPTLVGETVFVQGSIDLILKTADGKLLLFDYKTDRIGDSELHSPSLLAASMKEKHGYQLSCYALAVKRLFGKAPDQIFIYSIPLGRSIPIDIDAAIFEA